MGGKVWTLTQTEDALWYCVYGARGTPGAGRRCEEEPGKRLPGGAEVQQEEDEEKRWSLEESGASTSDEDLLRDYFQLGVHLGDLYKHWSAADTHFKHTASVFTGVRLLRQEPVECLFSFICSSNNHISRIQGMIERLCQTLGPLLCTLDGVAYHGFPALRDMAEPSMEQHLRDLGFGYRARFLQQSSRLIMEAHEPNWLLSLRSAPYLLARDALRTLPGVGLKVADCVALMSLDKLEALPVDTHVWQIAKRDYKFPISTGPKTLTDRVYQEIGDCFRELWGPYAGWAHSVLFCADLKKFQRLKGELPLMRDVKAEPKRRDRKRGRSEETCGRSKHPRTKN